MKSIGQVEREVVFEYITSRWKRSKISALPGVPDVPDPGHGEDEICPVVWYDQPFDPSKSSDLAAVSVYATRELKGYGYWTLDVQDGAWSGQQLPLNLVAGVWTLEAPGGSVTVLPATTPEDGSTITFTLVDDSTFTAIVSSTWLHGVGYVVLNLSELRAEKVRPGSNAPFEAWVKIQVMIAAPMARPDEVAEQYMGAVAGLLRGVRIKGDATAAVGTHERDMADAGIYYIYQRDAEAVTERPIRIAERDAWSWHLGSVTVRRLYTAQAAGLQAVSAA